MPSRAKTAAGVGVGALPPGRRKPLGLGQGWVPRLPRFGDGSRQISEGGPSFGAMFKLLLTQEYHTLTTGMDRADR